MDIRAAASAIIIRFFFLTRVYSRLSLILSLLLTHSFYPIRPIVRSHTGADDRRRFGFVTLFHGFKCLW